MFNHELKTKKEKAWSKALSFITYRQRSKKETKDYLLQKKYAPDIVDEVIEKLKVYGFLNDEIFVQEWAEYSLKRGRGLQRIKQELWEKGIEKDIIETVLNNSEEFTFEKEYERASQVIKKYLPEDYSKSDRNLIRKSINHLKRRGFSHEIVYEIIKVYFD